ncbi:hypothetical protein H3H54_16010 [Brachybacterium sp. Z12]|uniref:hypothetical protein n=1 Tax=Brachybacterium sp. Z12 TaxID=2759167 RepID=UPI00186181E3|nr:hypothetical protein [Brachybacterium sp. Z12]QNN82455.1 hypothetical protein H3H54_16010 [Brachybacterium sp. Z12]
MQQHGGDERRHEVPQQHVQVGVAVQGVPGGLRPVRAPVGGVRGVLGERASRGMDVAEVGSGRIDHLQRWVARGAGREQAVEQGLAGEHRHPHPQQREAGAGQDRADGDGEPPGKRHPEPRRHRSARHQVPSEGDRRGQ